jgi:hypothetical protein
MQDTIFLCDLLESKVDSEKQMGNEFNEKIRALAEKYKDLGGNGTDIELNESIPLESRGSKVYGFYVYQGWVYLLDDEGMDIDPKNVETEFLEKFINYVSDEGNLNVQ